MVPDMRRYIQACGLETADVPKVMGTFVAMKYTTLGAFIVLGARYQPLRRVFARRQALSALKPWAQRQSQRLDEALSRPHDIAIRRSTNPFGKKLGRAFAAARGRYNAAKDQVRAARDQVRAARDQVRAARDQVRDARETWQRKHSHWNRQLLTHQQRAFKRLDQERRLLRLGWGGVYGWATANYWHYSDKMRALAQNSRVWSSLSRTVGTDPSRLALGVAEGAILYKLTFVLHVPLQLWLIVNAFKTRRNYLQNRPADCAESDPACQPE